MSKLPEGLKSKSNLQTFELMDLVASAKSDLDFLRKHRV